MRYAMIAHDNLWPNSGDQIQALAGMAFLPHVDELAIFHKFSDWKPKELTKIICNQYFFTKFFTAEESGERPDMIFPTESIVFHENVDPLFLSVHIHSVRADGRVDISERVKDYLTIHGPIGTRDLSTLRILQDNNIPAYFSGCLTLALNPKHNITRQEYILTTDLSPQLLRFLSKKTTRPIYDISALIGADRGGPLEELIAADVLLDLLQSAFCVITPRLHISAPCLALGTPVFLVYRENFEDFGETPDLNNHPRFSGYSDLLRHATEKEYMRDYSLFDLDSPPKNSDAYKKLRALQIEKVNEYLAGESVYQDGANRMTFLEKQRFLNLSKTDYEYFFRKICIGNAFEFGKVENWAHLQARRRAEWKGAIRNFLLKMGMKQETITQIKQLLIKQ